MIEPLIEVDSLANQMSRLGLHANASAAHQQHPESIKFVKPGENLTPKEERARTFL